MKKMRKNKYPLVHVRFLDHCLAVGDNTAPIPSDAFGLLHEETDTSYAVAYFVSGGAVSGDDSNSTIIVKHPGIKVTRVGYAIEYKTAGDK